MSYIQQKFEEAQLYKSAIDKWGEDMQIEIAIEECAELIKAIQKYKRNGPDAELIHSLISEIADVSIMIEQLTLIFGAEHVNHWRGVKLERLKERLK